MTSWALLLRFWGHLRQHRRLQLGLLLVLMLTTGVAELVSLGAVVPFLASLVEPDQLWNIPAIQYLSNQVGINNANDLRIHIILLFILSAICAAIIRIFALWFSAKLSAMVGSDLSCELYSRTLYQPYKVHLQRNSSELIAAITTHTAITIHALNTVFKIAISTAIACAIFIGILVANWIVAISCIIIFGTSYAILTISTQSKLLKNSGKMKVLNDERVRSLLEGVGSIRNLILDSTHNYYIDKYSSADKRQRKLEAQNMFFTAFPKFAIEALGIIFLSMLGGILIIKNESSSNIISLIAVIALGSQKLMPCLQQIYSGIANLRSWNASLTEVVKLLNQPLPNIHGDIVPVKIKTKIKLEEVEFRYDKDGPLIIRSLSLEIKRGERIGLIGTTGSGKSTLVDLLMGLLTPEKGKIIVDGQNLHDSVNALRLARWRISVANVPQSIFLSDTSFAENIALGVPKRQIDMDRVKKAADNAQISKFIETSANGYESTIGERGVRLSGGQRQRLGIARAFYKNANLIVLDEATSALDTNTEQSVMDSINSSIRGEHTIIMIAHRLSTLKGCDRIIEIEKGKISSIKTPEEYSNMR